MKQRFKPYLYRFNIRRFGKSLAPILSRACMNSVTGPAVATIEVAAATLRGKGGSASWNLDAEVKAMSHFVRSSKPVLVDVGANFGEWTRKMTSKFPDYHRAILIEPQPDCLRQLHRLELERAQVVGTALSAKSGSAVLHTTDEVKGWGASSLYERQDTYFKEVKKTTIDVAVTTLDQVAKDCRIGTIDFLKMDIEGAEYSALLGATRILSDGSVRALSFEFGAANLNSRTYLRDFWNLLSPLGFRFHRILPHGKASVVHNYDEELEYFRGVTNYIAERTG